MPKKRRHYLTNFDRIPEYTRQVSACTVSVHPAPASFCSVCGDICRSIPFIILDGNGEVICDFCAASLHLPALKLKKAYDDTLRLFEGNYEIGDEISYYWRIAMQHKEIHRPDLDTKALIDTLCDNCAAFGIIQAYLVSMHGSPIYMRLTSSYVNDDMVDEVFKRAEPAITNLIESAQDDQKHIEYFYIVDAMYYPPGLNPVKEDDIEPNLPSWKWPLRPENG